MIRMDDIPEFLEMYAEGTLTKRDILAYVLELIERHDVDEIVAALPAPLQVEFLQMARADYDNDVPAERFISVESYCGVGDPPQRDTALVVGKIRAWLARRS